MQPQVSMESAWSEYAVVTKRRRPNLSKVIIMKRTRAHCTDEMIMIVWKGFLKPAKAYVYVAYV